MKVLIIRFSSIGDIVLTAPVIRCLALQKNATVHYLTKAAFAAIPAAHPMVQKVFALGKGTSADQVVFSEKLPDLLAVLKSEQYDYIVDLHHNLRSFRIKWALKKPAFSFDKLNFEKWLLVRTGINRMPDRHIVHRYMDTVQPLGVTYDGQGLDFHIPAHLVPAIDQKIDQWTAAWEGAPFIVFVTGATYATKRLPLEKIKEICSKLRHRIVLVGGPDEQETGAQIAAVAPNRILNTCGHFTLFESARIVQKAQQVISHDTGMMHIAAAFHKRIVSVWGNTVPAFGMFPFYPDGMQLNASVEVENLSCRPCSKIGFNACPKGHFNCMNQIDSAQILLETDC